MSSKISPSGPWTEPGFVMEMVPERDEALIRSLLSKEQNDRCPKDMISRYWRATGKDTRHAARRLKDTLSWWDKERPSEVLCPACPLDKPGRCSHYMQIVCKDKLSRPVIYSCLQLAQNKNMTDNYKHMVMVFETAIRMMTPGVEQWCWILDFHGFSVRDCDPRLARIFLHLAATHYPERLGNFWIIDAPVLFNTLWSAISPFIDPKTKKKIAFLSIKRQKALEAKLVEHFDEEDIRWLITEMQENRQKQPGAKFYDYGALQSIDKITKDGHVNLGTPSFLQDLAINIDRLPQQIVAMARKGNGTDV